MIEWMQNPNRTIYIPQWEYQWTINIQFTVNIILREDKYRTSCCIYCFIAVSLTGRRDQKTDAM